MAKKAKEKTKKKSTKDEQTLNLDNEIIIGIKTLPEPKIPKNKKQNNKAKNTKSKKQKGAQKPSNKNQRVSANNNSSSKKTKRKQVAKNRQNDFELDLGIKEETKKKKSKKLKPLTKEQELAKKKRKKVFRVIKYTSLLVILIAGGIYFMLSPFFNIKQITTLGNSRISSEEIISLSNITLEENTFKIRKKEVVQAIKENAYIDEVTIKRKLPNTIEISVTERTPTFMLNFANAYVYLNNQGYLLEISKTSLNLPTITGFLTPEEEIKVGNRLCSEDLQRLDHALQIMKSADSNNISKLITKINISDKQDYVLELTSEKKTIYMGDTSNLSTKMLYIISILEENKNIEGEIFVNTDLSNKGAIFRKKV